MKIKIYENEELLTAQNSNKPVASARFNDGEYRVDLAGDRPVMLHLLLGAIIGTLKQSPPRIALRFYEYMLNAISKVNTEICCEALLSGSGQEVIEVEFPDDLLRSLDEHYQAKEEHDAKDPVSDAD